MDRAPDGLFVERRVRCEEAIRLEVPDRVPLEFNFGYFPAKYRGFPYDASHYDHDMAELIERGFTSMVMIEGDDTSRLEYLLELPEGKAFLTSTPPTCSEPKTY